MNDILKTLGRNLRARREAKTFSKARLAQVSGVSLRFLNDVELGLANPSVRKLHALAEALDTSIAAFFVPGFEMSPRLRISLLGIRGAGNAGFHHPPDGWFPSDTFFGFRIRIDNFGADGIA